MSALFSETHKRAKNPTISIVPRATYRLQLNHEFTFRAAQACIPYLAKLKISHLYLSPIFRAHRGSMHGYDVVSHAALNPELGSEEDFAKLASVAREHGMGIVIDIVPNHMAVAANDNAWWADVLENGPAAQFADYFDIDWRPARVSMRDRLLIPVLGERYGDELRSGRIQIGFDADSGNFYVLYGEQCFPLDPKEYPLIFRNATIASIAIDASNDESEIDQQEFESLLDDFSRLPTRSDIASDRKLRRYRDKEVCKRRLARLCKRSPDIVARIAAALTRINGIPGDMQSFEVLADLLAAQPYRLAFWKVAGDEINYRRFFDVNQLAALRVEEPAVFAATHSLALGLLAARKIDGLRVDHVDGLHDPKAYLDTLCDVATRIGGFRPYIVVEKILATHERLRDDWKVNGTTGYEFGAAVVQWLVADEGMVALDQTYKHYARISEGYDDLIYRCKKLIMRTSLAAEIAVLAGQLDRIAQANPDTMDFTHFALRDALTEVIACFPVYRTYIADSEIDADDRQSIAWAVGAARKASRASDRSIFSFIEDVLSGKPNVATTDAQREAMLNFTMKLQQVSSPVMAKSVEDTGFYRYARLLALNEVGSDPRVMGLANQNLHKMNQDCANKWPHSLLATSTHDSKRGEDIRYRLAVLSELPREWREHVHKWSRFNRSKQKWQIEGATVSRNDEYFLLQTILSVWPANDTEAELSSLSVRLKEYALKAVRESKEVTAWVDPDSGYEAAILDFVDGLLHGPRGEHFRAEFGEFARTLAFFGTLNGLSALILKCTSPGVPDFYQGTELPELSLVDPDNRRAVDFDLRATFLSSLSPRNDDDAAIQACELLHQWRDGRIKIWAMRALLELRYQHAELFAKGEYEALTIYGTFADHILAFARHYEQTSIITVVSRWTSTLRKASSTFDATHPAPVADAWADTCVRLSTRLANAVYTNLFTKQHIEVKRDAEGGFIELRNAFAHLPMAVLL